MNRRVVILTLGASVLIVVGLIANRQDPRAANHPSAVASPRSQEPTSPPVASPRIISRAGECGGGATFIDYLGGAGSPTPEDAVRDFIRGQTLLQPTDPRAIAERDAVVASGPLIREEGPVFNGHHQFAARDDDGVLAIYWVSGFPPDKFVVDSFWARFPPELCPPSRP